MPLVIQNTRRDGHSGLSTPITVGVCIASSIAALIIGAFAWMFIVRRRNKGTAHSSASAKSQPFPTTVAHQPRKLEPTHPVGSRQAQDQTNQILSPKPSPSPAYSPGLVKVSSASNKKSAPPLNVDVDLEVKQTLPSPLRSVSFKPTTKTWSIGSRISSRVSVGAKKLPRLMVVAALYVPSLSDELPIRLGEAIRMIEEYEDEWCLVQRVGRADERGVVPRFCLIERQDVIPRTGQGGSGGLFQTSVFRK